MATSADNGARGRWRADLRPWQRFSVRLAAWYGGAAVLLVAVLLAWSYSVRVQGRMEQLRDRIGLLAVGAALNVDGDAVSTRLEGADAEAYWEQVADRFRRLAAETDGVGSIYLLRSTGDPARYEILVDVTPDRADLSEFREIYDATAFPVLTEGLRRPTVEDELGREVYDYDGDGRPDTLWSISGYAPVHDGNGRSVAVVGVDVLADHVRHMRNEVLLQALVLFGVAFAVFGAVSVFLGRQIVGPLGEVIDATDAVAHGDLDVRIRSSRTDEFGLLGRYFDTMAEGLEDREFLRDTFGRYVSPRVADAILADRNVAIGGEEREVTILFTDLRGYSTIAEAARPTEVVSLLNDFFEAMSAIVDAHEGVIIEYTGDGILAVFGAPVKVPDHPRRAAACAIAMRSKVEELNAVWDASGRSSMWKSIGIDRLVMRIGVHTGRVVAGNLGSASRMKYAVIGDTVNVAGRLEQLNKSLETTILVSGTVRARLDDSFVATPRGAAKVKGRGEPVEVFSL